MYRIKIHFVVWQNGLAHCKLYRTFRHAIYFTSTTIQRWIKVWIPMRLLAYLCSLSLAWHDACSMVILISCNFDTHSFFYFFLFFWTAIVWRQQEIFWTLQPRQVGKPPFNTKKRNCVMAKNLNLHSVVM